MKRLVAVAAVLALAACGGGSHVPAPAAHAGATSGTAQYALLIPNAAYLAAHHRSSQFVSPATLSAGITIGTTTTNYDLGASSPLCSNVTNGRLCTMQVSAPIGTQTAQLLLYSSPCAGGPPCTTYGLLSGASNIPLTINEGAANVTVPLILGGLPAAVDVSAGLTAHSTSAVPLTFIVYDSSNNVIVGPGTFIDQTGTTVPLTFTATTFGNQAVLHDGAQSGTSISVASPVDAVTISLSGSADVLGVPLRVKLGTARLTKLYGTQFLPVSGTPVTNEIAAATFTDQPDYDFFAHIDGTQTSGVPDGLAFSYGTESSGEKVGWFDSDQEVTHYCTTGGSFFNQAVTAVDGGIAVGYNGDFGVLTPPTGVQFIPAATIIAGGSCGATNRQATGNLSRSLGWDETNSQILDSASDGVLRFETLSGSTIGTATTIPGTTNAGAIYAFNGLRFWLQSTSANAITYQHYPAAVQTLPVSGASLSTLTIGEDGRAYALDPVARNVYVTGDGSSSAATNGTFAGSLSASREQLAIGPDGTAYATDGGSTIYANPMTGVQQTATITPPGGNTGNVVAVFDGHNGYVYALYNDGLHAGAQYIFRISN